MYRITPEQELKDTLYELQAAREMSGREQEPAVVANNFVPDCSVFKDKNTGDRIVLTPLPRDDADFTEATVWLSNPVGLTILSDELLDVIDVDEEYDHKDIVLFIGKGATALCFDDASKDTYQIDTQLIADMLRVPRILPVPQSEIDPREFPADIDFLYVPTSDTYTLATRIFDSELENNRRLLANRSGIISDKDQRLISYDLQISELLPTNPEVRLSEFDREMQISMRFSDDVSLAVRPLGDPEIRLLTNNGFRIKVVREGMIIDAKNAQDNIIKCIPTLDTKELIDQILQNAQDITLNS